MKTQTAVFSIDSGNMQ